MGINMELFQKYFNFQVPSFILKDLDHTTTKKENIDLVNRTKSGFSNLKEETEEMSENQKAIQTSDKIVNIVEEILEFNRQNQQRQELKILTLEQMRSRLPISLA